jgi:oligopeptidase A
MAKPLFQEDGIPVFLHIDAGHIAFTIGQLLKNNRRKLDGALQKLNQEPPTWQNLIELLETLDDQIERGWAPISHMNAVMNSDQLREAYNACLPMLSDYSTEMGQNEALFEACQTLAQSDQNFTPAQRKVLDNMLRDFHLSGVSLPEEKKQRFKKISQQLSQLGSQFSDNILDVNNAWSSSFEHVEALAGLPQTALDLAAQTAEQRDMTGWLLTLEYPSYAPVMMYADDRNLRQQMYEAYNTRASDQGPHDKRHDNTLVMRDILALRHELAGLLGYANYAEYSLVSKMANACDEVMDFLNGLAKRAKPQAEKELAELQAFATGLDGLTELQAWDIAYYSEKLRQQRYTISQEEVRAYFPVDKVLSGLFELVERLYNVSFNPVKDQEVWHPDVTFYEIRHADGRLRGQFYMDLYARQHKRGGAWMDTCQSRLVNQQIQQHPIAYLTCNFTPPVGDKPSLLTHDEVQTLFHEFGHGLHHMLTDIDHLSISGINGVAWDAVELPSQFMENFCWQRPVLDMIAGHYETGEPLPEEMFQRMLAAKNFQSAMMIVRQLEFALFDLRIHREYQPGQEAQVTQIIHEVRELVAVVKPPEWQRFAHSFSHIFAGGYAAGYYSYLWAEVLSADAFSLFEEQGIFDQATGLAFLHNILEQGGAKDAAELFRDFRGRDPQIDALLRHSGIAA